MLLAGVLAFFFFTRRIPLFAQEAPTLNYYWVPLLVRHHLISWTLGAVFGAQSTRAWPVVVPSVVYHPLQWGLICYTPALSVPQVEGALQGLCAFTKISFHVCFAQTSQSAKADGVATMTVWLLIEGSCDASLSLFIAPLDSRTSPGWVVFQSDLRGVQNILGIYFLWGLKWLQLGSWKTSSYCTLGYCVLSLWSLATAAVTFERSTELPLDPPKFA